MDTDLLSWNAPPMTPQDPGYTQLLEHLESLGYSREQAQGLIQVSRGITDWVKEWSLSIEKVAQMFHDRATRSSVDQVEAQYPMLLGGTTKEAMKRVIERKKNPPIEGGLGKKRKPWESKKFSK